MARRSLVLLCRHGGGTGVGGTSVIRVASDVRYSSVHRRNVVDVYQRSPFPAASNVGASAGETRDRADPLRGRGEADDVTSRRPSDCWVLFVHGGMWLRGDKDRPTLSAYDVFSSVYWGGSGGGDREGRDPLQRHRSNVGRTVAAAGGVGCVMNYRLASPGPRRREDERPDLEHAEERDYEGSGRHPDQVMDVARCIAFLSQEVMPPGGQLFVGGHSAGAHLAALALADTRYLDAAFEERGMLPGYDDLIGGFFGVSGVYNLPRLGMDPITAPLTVGPAFGHGREGLDVLRDASPLHALLRAESSWVIPPPPLARVPLLLLNAAENDWGLERDSEELLVALSRFDRIRGVDGDVDGNDDGGAPPERSHHLISSRNHFSIERMFGDGIEQFLKAPPQERHVRGDPFDAATCIHDIGDYSSSQPVSRKPTSKEEDEASANHKENVIGQKSTQTSWYDALLAGGTRIAGGYLPDPSEWYASAVGYVWPQSPSPPNSDAAAGRDEDGVVTEKEGDVDEAAVLVLRFLGLTDPSADDPSMVELDDEGKVSTGDDERR